MVAERYAVLLCDGQQAGVRQLAEQARQAAAEFDVFGCAPECRGAHELLAIVEAAEE